MTNRLPYDELQAAINGDLCAKALDLLVQIAQQEIVIGDKTLAADILALALAYPLRQVTRDLAETLFDDLERELCPRVIWDARASAEETTLDEMVARVLESAAR